MSTVLLTFAQVEERLGLCRSSVYSLVQRGELPSFRLGNRVRRIKESDLEAFIERMIEESE